MFSHELHLRFLPLGPATCGASAFNELGPEEEHCFMFSDLSIVPESVGVLGH